MKAVPAVQKKKQVNEKVKVKLSVIANSSLQQPDGVAVKIAGKQRYESVMQSRGYR